MHFSGDIYVSFWGIILNTLLYEIEEFIDYASLIQDKVVFFPCLVVQRLLLAEKLPSGITGFD